MSEKMIEKALNQFKRKYMTATKEQKNVLLDAFCDVTGYHRSVGTPMPEKLKQLAALRETIDPFQLSDDISKLLEKIRSMKTKKGITSAKKVNVYEEYKSEIKCLDSLRSSTDIVRFRSVLRGFLR